jgi:ribosomal protein S12 methylthiotransferase accessory factor
LGVDQVTAAAEVRLRPAQLLEQALSRRPGPTPKVVALGVEDLFDAAAEAQADERAAATVHLAADMVVIGPFSADGRPCGHCLGLRWQRLRAQFLRTSLELGEGAVALGSWPEITGHLADAVWALHRAAEEQPPDPRCATASVWAMDVESLVVRRFPLTTEPLCPRCGDPGTEPVTVHLPAAPKRAEDDYRGRSARDFGLPRDVLVNPVCGVLGAQTFTAISSPTTAPVTGRVQMRGHYGLADMTWSGQGNSFRDSLDLAFFEGLERYAGISRRHRGATVVAAYDDIADHALDPRECGMYSDLTYELDEAVDPFDPATPIPWVWGLRLGTGESVLVPRRLVYYGGEPASDNFVFDSSNGCASGATLPEAILYGLLELIERDAFVLGWYGGARLTELDVSESRDRELRMMLDRAALQGYDVHLFDNRVDLPVPAVTGLAVRRDGGPGYLSFAAAAAMDPQAAVRGAIGEILTYLPELPNRLRDRGDEVRAMVDDYFLVRQLRDHPALFSLPEMAPHASRYLEPQVVRPVDEAYAGWLRDRPHSMDMREDVAFLRAELAAAGHDVIVVEQTAPEQRVLGLHTVAAIVPGLLPLDFGWARQRALRMPRMFSAYRRAGWQDADLTEADLHRVPHPFP